MGMIIQNGRIFATGEEYHKYSTDEKVVGTWIDGSTIYEKTFIANGLTGDVRGWTYFADLLGVDTVIEYNGSAHLIDGSNVELGYYIIVNWVNNTLKYYCKEFNTLTFDLKLTIRYTKTESNTRSLNLSKGSSDETKSEEPVEEKKSEEPVEEKKSEEPVEEKKSEELPEDKES